MRACAAVARILSPGRPSAGCPERGAWQVRHAAAARPSASASAAAERRAAMRASAPRAARGLLCRPRSAPAPAAKRCTPSSPRPGGLGQGRECVLGARGGARAARGAHAAVARPAHVRRVCRWQHNGLVSESACTSCVCRRRVTAVGALTARQTASAPASRAAAAASLHSAWGALAEAGRALAGRGAWLPRCQRNCATSARPPAREPPPAPAAPRAACAQRLQRMLAACKQL